MTTTARRPRRQRRNKVYVELEGQEDVRRAFAKLEFNALRNVKAVIAESAAEIEREAKARAPVSGPDSRKASTRPGSGETRDTIFARVVDFGLGALIGSWWYNARFQEQGVEGRPGRPFLNPAFQLVKPRYLDRLRKALGLAAKEANA